MQYNKGNTSNTILILILVLIVGFVVWYVTTDKQATRETSGVEINLGGDDSSQR